MSAMPIKEIWTVRYSIMLRLPGSDQWWQVVEALTPEAAGEVVRILLSQGAGSPGEIKIEVRVI